MSFSRLFVVLVLFALAAAGARADEHVNSPPVAIAKPLVARVADASCTVTITPADADAGSFDPDGGSFGLSLSQATFSGAGDHPVVLTATDEHGLSHSATTILRVIAPATADVDPDVIKTASNGKYVTAYLAFESACAGGPADVDMSTLTLQAIDPFTSVKLLVATGSPTAVGDGNGNGVLDRSVRFDRAAVQSWFSSDGPAILRVEGKFLDGTSFSGDAAPVQIRS